MITNQKIDYFGFFTMGVSAINFTMGVSAISIGVSAINFEVQFTTAS